MRVLLAILPLVALGACSVGDDQSSADATASSSASASPSPSGSPSDPGNSAGSDGDDPGGVGDQPDASDTDACAQVRAGVDDFNAGDLQGTVSHFKQALPLARSQAADNDSAGAQDLLDAVEYYADLAPEDYPMASASSPDFAKYKVITLGQCVVPEQQGPGGSPSPSGQSV